MSQIHRFLSVILMVGLLGGVLADLTLELIEILMLYVVLPEHPDNMGVQILAVVLLGPEMKKITVKTLKAEGVFEASLPISGHGLETWLALWS